MVRGQNGISIILYEASHSKDEIRFCRQLVSHTAGFLKSVRLADFVERDRWIVKIKSVHTEKTFFMDPTVHMYMFWRDQYYNCINSASSINAANSINAASSFNAALTLKSVKLSAVFL